MTLNLLLSSVNRRRDLPFKPQYEATVNDEASNTTTNFSIQANTSNPSIKDVVRNIKSEATINRIQHIRRPYTYTVSLNFLRTPARWLYPTTGSGFPYGPPAFGALPVNGMTIAMFPPSRFTPMLQQDVNPQTSPPQAPFTDPADLFMYNNIYFLRIKCSDTSFSHKTLMTSSGKNDVAQFPLFIDKMHVDSAGNRVWIDWKSHSDVVMRWNFGAENFDVRILDIHGYDMPPAAFLPYQSTKPAPPAQPAVDLNPYNQITVSLDFQPNSDH